MGKYNHFTGIAIGGPLDGQTITTRWNHHITPIPLPDPGPTPPPFGSVQPDDKIIPDRMEYRHIELWAASHDNPDKTRYGFWVPRENFADSHRHVLNALVESYARANKPLAPVHAHIKERSELAQTYAEDGAFFSSARVFYDLANEVEKHAEAVNVLPDPGELIEGLTKGEE